MFLKICAALLLLSSNALCAAEGEIGEEKKALAVSTAVYRAKGILKSVEDENRKLMESVPYFTETQAQLAINDAVSAQTEIILQTVRAGGRTDLIPVYRDCHYCCCVGKCGRSAYDDAVGTPFAAALAMGTPEERARFHPLDLALRDLRTKYSHNAVARPFIGSIVSCIGFLYDLPALVPQTLYWPAIKYHWKPRWRAAAGIVLLVAYATTEEALILPGFWRMSWGAHTEGQTFTVASLKQNFDLAAAEFRRKCGPGSEALCSDEKIKAALFEYAMELKKTELSVDTFESFMMSKLQGQAFHIGGDDVELGVELQEVEGEPSPAPEP